MPVSTQPHVPAGDSNRDRDGKSGVNIRDNVQGVCTCSRTPPQTKDGCQGQWKEHWEKVMVGAAHGGWERSTLVGTEQGCWLTQSQQPPPGSTGISADGPPTLPT